MNGPVFGGQVRSDEIGKLHDYESIVSSTSYDNRIDAAIASTTTSSLGNATPSAGYGTPKSTTATAVINQKVKKYGRTTELTKGQVFAINATVNIGYGKGVARFVNQIVITPGNFSASGAGKGGQVPQRTIEQVQDAQTGDWMAIPGVEGTAMGFSRASRASKFSLRSRPSNCETRYLQLSRATP